MKTILLLSVCAALLAGSPLVAETAAPPAAPVPASPPNPPKVELRGILVTSGTRQFMLSNSSGATSEWVGLGDSFGDWNLVSYREKDGTLLLRKGDGTELDLVLASSKVGAADVKATLADAQRVLAKIHFGEMLGKMLGSQQKTALAAMRKQLEKSGMSADQIDKMIAQQTNVMKQMWSSIDMKSLQNSMAQIYSEEFTADQLNGISQFYDTDAGQATLEKAPEIQQKLMQVLMPQIMAATAQQMRAAGQAQKAAPASPAAPSASKTP